LIIVTFSYELLDGKESSLNDHQREGLQWSLTVTEEEEDLSQIEQQQQQQLEAGGIPYDIACE
jgi:hypothetical protein